MDCGERKKEGAKMSEMSEPDFIIPENDHISEFGEMTINQIVDLLRKYKTNPEAVQFIADMLEE
jgi:hypothetical protein